MGETVTPEHDPLRARLRDVVTTRNIGMPEAARLSGVAYATLNAWLNSKYAGNNGRIAEQVETWLSNLDEQAQTRAAGPVIPGFVATPTAAAFLRVLEHAQYVPDIAVVTGGAGVGKTTGCQEYRRTHVNCWIVTGRPSRASVHSVLEAVCEVLGINEPSVSRRTGAIVKKLTGSGGLLIIDEAQHLTSAALDELRSVHDLAGIGLALVGNEDVYARLDGGGRKAQFAQLFSRVGMRIARARPLAGDVDALLDAVEVPLPEGLAQLVASGRLR